MYGILGMEQNAFHHYFIIFDYNHPPVKATICFLILFAALMPIVVKAQNMGSDNRKFTTLGQLWLEKPDGSIITTSEDSISREVFNTPPIVLKCSRAFKPGEGLFCIFQPPSGEGWACWLVDNRLSVEVLSRIKATAPGTILTIMVQNANGPAEFYALRMILK
jgi:hypothetical protein